MTVWFKQIYHLFLLSDPKFRHITNGLKALKINKISNELQLSLCGAGKI